MIMPVIHAALVVLLFATGAYSQEHIRVPERQTHADIKAGPSSGSIALVLIPSGTVLPIVGRQGEWLRIALSSDLRKRGISVRWYNNEDVGFVHESTVEVVKGSPPAAQPILTEPPPSQPPREYVRVPARQTNTDVKARPTSTAIVLLLVPSGSVLPAVGRTGEWIEVALVPELRRVGTPIRWYKDERTGFVHESTVEIFTR